MKSVTFAVSGVKQYERTRLQALEEERQFALAVGLRFPPWLAVNRRGQELSPTYPSLRSQLRTDTTPNSPVKGAAACPSIMPEIYCTPSRFRALPRANRIVFELTVIPALTPHPAVISVFQEIGGTWSVPQEG
jgi:hypothetical protein